jgi:hypothetical protein
MFRLHMLFYGCFYGGLVTLWPAFMGDSFGRQHVGAIVGFMFAVAGGIGAWDRRLRARCGMPQETTRSPFCVACAQVYLGWVLPWSRQNHLR